MQASTLDLLSYYAHIGISQSSPTDRASGLRIVAALARKEPRAVRAMIPRLRELSDDAEATPTVQSLLLEIAVFALSDATVGRSNSTHTPLHARDGSNSNSSDTWEGQGEPENDDRDNDAADVVAACEDIIGNVIRAGVSAPVARFFVSITEHLLVAVPSLVRVWVEAAVSLPPAMLGAALGVDAVSGAPLARHSGSTVLERLPPGIGSMNGTTTTAAEDGRGRVVGGIFRNAATTATAAASSFPSPTDIANALGDAVLEAGLQQLNNSHLLLLTATLMDERNRSGSGGGNSSSSSMIAPVRRLADYIFVGLCKVDSCPLAARILEIAAFRLPDDAGAALLRSPTLQGALLLLLQPSAAASHSEEQRASPHGPSVECVGAMLRRLGTSQGVSAACREAARDALQTFAARYPALAAQSALF